VSEPETTESSAPPSTEHPAPAPPARWVQANPEAIFGLTLRTLTPRGFVTEALVAANVLVFVVMVARGVAPMEPKIVDLIAWGAGYGPRTTGGEWWRLLTATFLHIGAIHLAFNMYVLWDAGRLVERIFGNAGFLVLYLSAGLAGSVASTLWSPYVVSAGASGAVFGVYGGLLGFLVRERGSIPREALTKLQRGAVTFLGYNLLFGLSQKGIDMAAHLGGLGGGFVGGLVLAHPLDARGASFRHAREAILAAGTAVAIVAAAHFMPRSVDLQAELERYDAMETRALGKYNDAIGELKAHRLTAAQMADEIDGDILPEWRASRDKLAGIAHLPEKQAKLVASVVACMNVREEAFRLMAEGARSDDVALIKRANEKHAEATGMEKQIGAKP
jgi:rhomboid protease GluP